MCAHLREARKFYFTKLFKGVRNREMQKLLNGLCLFQNLLPSKGVSPFHEVTYWVKMFALCVGAF